MNVGSAELVGRFQVGSAEWHAARANGLGGSEIAAVVGLSPFESNFSLFFRKIGDLGPVEETPEMLWGKLLEPVVAQRFLSLHPEYVAGPTGTYRHTDRPWQIANPDLQLVPFGGTATATVLEVKTSPYGDNWGEHGTDQIPPHVRCQVIWYGDVFGFNRAHVACLIGGCDYREYLIEWDEDEAALLRDAGRRFLDDIANGVRPDIDSSTHTYQAIRELNPDIDPRKIELAVPVAADFITSRERLAEAKAAEQRARSIVVDLMGTAQRATCNGHTICRRQSKKHDGALPYAVAAKNLPDPSELARPAQEKPAA